MTDNQLDPAFLTRALIALLDVVPAAHAGHFTGRRRPGGVGRVFGGQVVGQALMAAAKTVPEDRLVHSLHCYFMRPASEDHEIAYAVDADMDGRSFSNRRVVAHQLGKPIFNLAASFQRAEPGPAHQADMPSVTPPERLPSLRELIRTHEVPAGPVLRSMASRPSPIELRPVEDFVPDVAGAPLAPHTACWLRVGESPLGVPQAMQRAVLAFVSDLLLLATAYRPHGLQIGSAEVASASIDHSVWFHGDVECGEWLLYAMDSPFSGAARGFSRGQFYARDGRLVASVAQEGLMRLRDTD